MKVAVTIWDERISPVFDSARKLLVAEIREGEIKKLFYHPFGPQSAAKLTEDLMRIGIDVLICGAISEMHSTLIEASSIQLISFVGGNVNQILGAYASGNAIVPFFSMPGCAGEKIFDDGLG